MSKNPLSEFGLNREQSGDDVIVPFTLDKLGCRGRSVRLGAAINTIISRHDYPNPVARVLGEAVVLATLIGSSLKFDGRFILQTQSDGPINMVIVDFDTPDGLRAYARFDHDKLLQYANEGKNSSKELLGKGHMAMSIDQGADMERYQGIVELDGNGFENAAHQYFEQSEQIPTMVRLAVAQHQVRGQKTPQWRAAGILVQHLPQDKTQDKTSTQDDELVDENDKRKNDWVEAKSILLTLGDDELVDPDISPERLLFRLYHETGVRVFTPEYVEERCTCSAERIEDMLVNNFSPNDREKMIKNGDIEVKCEFCSTEYHFNPNQFDI